MIKHVLIILLLTVLIGCGRKEQPKVIVDAMDERPLVITKDGQLMFDSKPMTENELVTMVKERVEKGMLSKVRSQYGTIIVEPDPETPYGNVRKIEELIMKHGGTPASRFNPEESPTTDSTLSTEGAPSVEK